MKRFLACLSLLIFCAAASAADAAKIVKLGVVTKPGSAQNIVAEKFKLSLHVIGQGTGNKRCIGPRLTTHAGGAHFRGRGRRDNAGADDHPVG